MHCSPPHFDMQQRQAYHTDACPWSAADGWRAVAWQAGTAHPAGRGPTGGEHHEAQHRRDHPGPRPRLPGGAARRRGAAAGESPPHRGSDVHLLTLRSLRNCGRDCASWATWRDGTSRWRSARPKGDGSALPTWRPSSSVSRWTSLWRILQQGCWQPSTPPQRSRLLRRS